MSQHEFYCYSCHRYKKLEQQSDKRTAAGRVVCITCASKIQKPKKPRQNPINRLTDHIVKC